MRQAVTPAPTEAIDIDRLRGHLLANYVINGPSEGAQGLKMTAADLPTIALKLSCSPDAVKDALVKKGFNFYGKTCLPRPEGFEWLFPVKPIVKVKPKPEEEDPGAVHIKLDAGQSKIEKWVRDITLAAARKLTKERDTLVKTWIHEFIADPRVKPDIGFGREFIEQFISKQSSSGKQWQRTQENIDLFLLTYFYEVDGMYFLDGDKTRAMIFAKEFSQGPVQEKLLPTSRSKSSAERRMLQGSEQKNTKRALKFIKSQWNAYEQVVIAARSEWTKMSEEGTRRLETLTAIANILHVHDWQGKERKDFLKALEYAKPEAVTQVIEIMDAIMRPITPPRERGPVVHHIRKPRQPNAWSPVSSIHTDRLAYVREVFSELLSNTSRDDLRDTVFTLEDLKSLLGDRADKQTLNLFISGRFQTEKEWEDYKDTLWDGRETIRSHRKVVYRITPAHIMPSREERQQERERVTAEAVIVAMRKFLSHAPRAELRGKEFTRSQLRAFVSSHDTKETLERLIAYGFSTLSKPVGHGRQKTTKDVHTVLEKHLKGKSKWEQVKTSGKSSEPLVWTNVPAPNEQTTSIVASTVQLCQMILSEQNEGERARRLLTQVIDEISARFPISGDQQWEGVYSLWRRRTEERDESVVHNMHQASSLVSDILTWIRSNREMDESLAQWKSQTILRLEGQRERIRSYDKTELKTLEMVSDIQRELVEGARNFRYAPKKLQDILASARHLPLQQSHVQALVTMAKTIVWVLEIQAESELSKVLLPEDHYAELPALTVAYTAHIASQESIKKGEGEGTRVNNMPKDLAFLGHDSIYMCDPYDTIVIADESGTQIVHKWPVRDVEVTLLLANMARAKNEMSSESEDLRRRLIRDLDQYSIPFSGTIHVVLLASKKGAKVISISQEDIMLERERLARNGQLVRAA